jgi:hypothetical protein
MDFRDGLSADLPSPRDDEPASLRDDIIDELADHLACIYRREQLRGRDPSSARLLVLNQFGDPAPVARRLWFDAMKGKIMSQRILVSCCIFLTLLSLALVVVLWLQAIDTRRMAMMEALAREEARRAQAAQEEMIRQLAAVSKAVENPRAPDWIPVSFKLTQETIDGPPGVGFQAALGRGTGGSSKPEAIQRDSDAAGIVVFGVVQPGDWEFRISRQLEVRTSWYMQGKLNVGLGNKIEKAIICPRIPPIEPALKIQIDWPPDLAGKDLTALAVFRHKGFHYQPPLHWSLGPGPGSGWWSNRACFVTENEKRAAEVNVNGYYYWRLANTSETGMEVAKSPGANLIRQNQVYLDVAGLDLSRAPMPITWHEGAYDMVMIAVVKPTKNLAPSFHGERCALLALAGRRFLQESAHVLQEPPTDKTNPWNGAGGYGQKPFDVLPIGDSYWKEVEPRLVVKRDQPNVWTIHLPDELTKAAREKLRTLSEK